MREYRPGRPGVMSPIELHLPSRCSFASLIRLSTSLAKVSETNSESRLASNGMVGAIL